MSFVNKTSQQEDEEALIASPLFPMSSDLMVAPPAKWRRILRLILSALYQLLVFAVPSFLRQTPGPTTPNNISPEKPVQIIHAPKKYTTEYLDGVRGLASLIVFIFHWTHIQYPGTNTGYGPSKDPSLWQLPVIRFVYSGAEMVSIFFVVSGYVLTHRFIQKMYRQEYSSLYSSLTSLTFRRALRLFLPSVGSAILSFIFSSLGFVSIPTKIEGKKFHHGIPALIQYIDRESNPWTWESYMKGFYNPQLWSIALEYRGSMVVFLIVLGLARTRTPIRVAVESVIVAHAFGHKRWDVALFVAGMLIAEMDVFVQASSIRKAFMQKRLTKAIMITSIIVGVWLSGYPRDHALQSYGFGFLGGVWPHGAYRRRFWLGIASILIVAPMPFMPLLQSFFNTRPIRYLGKISFALYLVHGLGNRTIGVWLIQFTRQIVGAEGFSAYTTSYLISTVMYVPIIFWWSDMFWRGIDIPSTNFARWIEGSCAARAES